MIDISAWPDWQALLYVSSPFLIGMPGLFICIYLGYSRHLDRMLEALSNCQHIQNRIWLKHGGYFGRLLLVGEVAGVVVLFSNIFIRRDMAVSKDICQFPLYLKRWLTVMIFLMGAGFVWLMIAWMITEL